MSLKSILFSSFSQHIKKYLPCEKKEIFSLLLLRGLRVKFIKSHFTASFKIKKVVNFYFKNSKCVCVSKRSEISCVTLVNLNAWKI